MSGGGPEESGVSVIAVDARPTIVVRETTTWADFPSRWKVMLDEVYAVVREAGGRGVEAAGAGWQNVMLYENDLPTVEVGVLGRGYAGGRGRVVASALPGGQVARIVHRGSYAELGAAHRAVLEWCAASGRSVTGRRWEIYGHWREQTDELETEVCYELA
jgi:effector-binding domain-containing protein